MTGATKHEKIGYIRQEIPGFKVPSYNGERYEVMVPDTLDLQERATLAIHGLTEPTDPEADYEIYWSVIFGNNPPAMNHDWNDPIMLSKFLETLPLMRLISGSNQNMYVEQKWMEVTLHMLGPDGLAYQPVKGRPWARNSNVWGSTDADHFTNPSNDGRLLSAMTVYYLLDGSPLWKEAGKGIVQGLTGLAIDKGNYAYFPEGAFSPEEVRAKDAEMPTGIWSSLVGWVIQGLAHYYRATDYEPALTLCGKLATYLKDHGGYYDAECKFLPNKTYKGQEDWVHFHHHALPLLGLLDYAMVVKDNELVEFVRKGYEYGKSQGNILIGYFPEYIGQPGPQTSETCSVADMIALGIKLTEAGVGDYWDDVDRWVRNQFVENQLMHIDWAYRFAGQIPLSRIDETSQTTERVPERNVGAFAGWPSANDWQGSTYGSIMHCCTGNGARALYYVWENILHYDKGKLRVNLLMNRVSPWADVESHIPYTGQVDIKVKHPLDLSVRIPDWVKPEEVQVMVNGSKRRWTIGGRYAKVGSINPGEVVTLTFPITERTDKIYIEKQAYTIVRKGNDVISISPSGRWCPLYQRAHYRANQTRWRKINRFVTDQKVHW